MSLFNLPSWIKPHLYSGRNFSELNQAEIDELKIRIAKFQSDTPLISVVLPAWNEAKNIYRTLSSLAASTSSHPIEIIVINNNSTDNTQEVLDQLGVRSFLQPIQGTTFARQMGLQKAMGKYHLCADSDTFYPPEWIDLMVKPMLGNKEIVGVYGRYSFMPDVKLNRFNLYLYETITGFLIRLRKINREFINVLGFNMGFVTEVGRRGTGFEVTNVRKFDNKKGSEEFVDEAEDGRMALNLLKEGRLKMVTDRRARVFTSSRRLIAEGGILKSFLYRANVHGKRMGEYLSGNS